VLAAPVGPVAPLGPVGPTAPPPDGSGTTFTTSAVVFEKTLITAGSENVTLITSGRLATGETLTVAGWDVSVTTFTTAEFGDGTILTVVIKT
jgi:hypothetical protein